MKLPKPMIAHKAVSSSNIASVGYDEETGTLEVQFRNGGTYTAHNVPPDVARGLETSGSPGSYYSSNIKGAYDIRKK